MHENESPAAFLNNEVNKWLSLDDDLSAVVPLVVAVANCLSGPPVWMMIVAPPSSGKSDLIMGIAVMKGVRSISSITENTFASGKKREEDDTKNLSLLERLKANNEWLLAIKDFGTILSLAPQRRNAIFGQLREIYDGAFSATFGTGVEIDWKGKVGMLVGATPAVDKLQKWSAELGERFVQFRMSEPDQDAVSLMALSGVSDEARRKAALASAYYRAFKEASEAQSEPDLLPEAQELILRLCEFVVNARRPVHRPSGSNYHNNYQVGEREGRGRLSKVLGQLHRAAMLCYAHDVPAANRLVVRVGIDSMPGSRRKALRQLVIEPEGVTLKRMAAVLLCDENTAGRVLQDLTSLGLAVSYTPVKSRVYKPSREMCDLALGIFNNELVTQEALQKLFDLPINYTPERERERVGV